MLVAALVAQAVLVTPGFLPPTNGSLHILTERVETAAEERRYRLERQVRFRRAGDGYVAEVRLSGRGVSGPAGLAELTELGFAAIGGSTMVMHFDTRGEVTSIDGMPQIWERFVQALAQGAASRRRLPADQAAALAARVAAPLRSLSEARQRAMLGSLVTAALTSERIEPAGVSRPVQLPGTSAFGAPVTLVGTRSTVARGKLLEESTRVSAVVTLPAEGDSPARGGTVALERNSRFDPTSGLIETARETRRTEVDGRTVIMVTTTTVSHTPD